MVVFRDSYCTRLILLCALCIVGCSTQMARVAVRIPRKEILEKGKMSIAFLEGPKPNYYDATVNDQRHLKEQLTKNFVTTGWWEVVAPNAYPPESTMPHTPDQQDINKWAKNFANEVQAEVAAVVKLDYLKIKAGVHHVNWYYDASAGGQADLIDARTGKILFSAKESVSLANRIEYSSKESTHDQLLTRLAHKISQKLLLEKEGYYVDLEDPKDRSLRKGIEFASRGNWPKAITAWRERLGNYPHPALIHYNLAIAYSVIDDKAKAFNHLKQAIQLAPENSHYRKAFTQYEKHQRIEEEA